MNYCLHLWIQTAVFLEGCEKPYSFLHCWCMYAPACTGILHTHCKSNMYRLLCEVDMPPILIWLLCLGPIGALLCLSVPYLAGVFCFYLWFRGACGWEHVGVSMPNWCSADFFFSPAVRETECMHSFGSLKHPAVWWTWGHCTRLTFPCTNIYTACGGCMILCIL